MEIKSITVRPGDLLVLRSDSPLSQDELQRMSDAAAVLGKLSGCRAYVCSSNWDIFLGHPVLDAFKRIEKLTAMVDSIEDAPETLEEISGIAIHIQRQIWQELDSGNDGDEEVNLSVRQIPAGEVAIALLAIYNDHKHQCDLHSSAPRLYAFHKGAVKACEQVGRELEIAIAGIGDGP